MASYIIVECDECGDRAPLRWRLAKGYGPTSLRVFLRKQGWTRTEAGRNRARFDYCPDCSKREANHGATT